MWINIGNNLGQHVKVHNWDLNNSNTLIIQVTQFVANFKSFKTKRNCIRKVHLTWLMGGILLFIHNLVVLL